MPFDTPVKRIKVAQLPFSATFKLAYRNILRHRGRTWTTLSAVGFGVAALILSQGFVEDVFVQLGEAIVHSQTGHLQLAREGYFEHGAHQPERFLVADPEGDKKRIATLPEVEDAMARLSFSGLLNNGRTDLAVVGEGIEASHEEKLGSFLRISAGRRLANADRFGALVGHGVAQALGLKPGDRTVLLVNTTDGATNSLDLEVVGVFQSFSKEYDNRAVKISLAAAQELLNTKGANTLVVSLKKTSDTDKVNALLKERNVWRDQEVRTWYQINDFHPKTVALYNRQFGGLIFIILLMVLLSVVNAVNTAVFERTMEFGTARSLGSRSSDVFRLVMIENTLLGIGGCILGVAVGIGAANLISQIGIPMPPPPNADLGYTAYIRVTPTAVAGAALIGLIATVLASLVPAIRVARMHIATALRQMT